MTKRLATDYLSIGDLVLVPDHIAAPIVYSQDHPNGETVRIGQVSALLERGMVAVTFGPKTWDYSNREALQFSRVH
jgi:hypothetical protein